MAADFDISLFGDKQLQKKFKGLEKKIQKKILSKALRNAAKVVQASAKSKVPVDTGNLKRNIIVRKEKLKASKGIGIVVTIGSRAKLGIDANDKSFYPAAVELGTKNKSAQPYLRPAIQENRSRLIQQIGRELGKGIERLAKQK